MDEKLWKPKLGKGETGSAVIRFLPPSHGNPLPWVNRYQHAFKVNDRWFIEECPTTLEVVSVLFEKQILNFGQRMKNHLHHLVRKLKYYSNIYVVSDPLNPENEGKVFVYQFGPKIFEKITDAMKPKFADIQPIDPTIFGKVLTSIFVLTSVGTKFWEYENSPLELQELLETSVGMN